MDDKELLSLRVELGSIRDQLHRIENRLQTPTPPVTVPPPPPRPKPLVPENWEFRTSAPEPARDTSRFLGIVGVCCFVLAASFLIKLAIDSGWLTPVRQLSLVVLFGCILIVTGIRFRESDEEYLSLLPGAGIVVLHMAAYGGMLLYGLYDGWMAAALAGAVSALSLVLFRIFEQPFYVVVAVVGSYSSSLLLPTEVGGPVDVMVFFLIWDVAFAVLSLLLGSRTMTLLAAYLALGLFAKKFPVFGNSLSSPEMLQVAIFQAVQFAIFVGSVATYTVRRKAPLSSGEAWVYFPLLLFFYAIEYSLVVRLTPDWAPWMALGFAGAVFGVYHFARAGAEEEQLESRDMVHAFMAMVFFHAFYLEILPDRWTPWFALAVLGAILWAPKREGAQGRNPILTLVVLFVLGINYGKILLGYGAGIETGEWIVLGFACFLLLFIGYDRRGTGDVSQGEAWFPVLILADVQAMMGLHRLAQRMAATWFSAASGRFLVSILWGLFALAVLGWGTLRRDRQLARSSLFIFGLAAGKVLLFDVTMASPVVRILCLMTLGVVFYLGGYVYRAIERWDSTAS